LQPVAKEKYGIEIILLGIKQLGLPESITTKVFDRMRAERQREIMRFMGEGESEAIRIHSKADAEREYILAQARADATEIIGEAEAEAAQYYSMFEQNPELAIFLFNLKALETSLTNRTTLILDQQTPPFNLFRNSKTETDQVVEKLSEKAKSKMDSIEDVAVEINAKKLSEPQYPEFIT